jgi:hypothetical protein
MPRLRSRLRAQHGQTLPLVVLAIVALLGITGLVVDVGLAVVTKRQLQASVDLGILSGAEALPNAAAAEADALNHAQTNFDSLTHVHAGYNPTFVSSTGCVVAGCTALDKLSLTGNATSPTFFLKLFGFDHFNVSASGSACGPCDASPVAYDVVVVLDRSYSMCTGGNGGGGGSSSGVCADLANAVFGIKTLLPFFNPLTDRVGLALLSAGDNVAPFDHTGVYPCDSSNVADSNVNGKGKFYLTAGDFFDGTPASHDSWVVAPLANDFKNPDGTLNAASAVVSTLNCVQHKYWTPIAPAIQAASDELIAKSRPGVTKVIVFFSDGGGNTQPMVRDANGNATAVQSWYTPTAGNNLMPCHDAIGQADIAKAAGIVIFTIGYDLNSGGANNCNIANGGGTEPGLTARTTLQAIATDAGHFYEKATAGEVYSIFSAIGHQITSGGVRLVK